MAGAGGNGHYALELGSRGLAFGDAARYGAARIELQPGRARVSLVARGGKQLDSTDVPCTSLG